MCIRDSFKKKGRSDSFRYPDPKQIKLEQHNSRIFLPKLGWIRYRKSRDVLGAVKNVTVSLSGGKWFVSIQTEREVEQPAPQGGAVGIELADAPGVGVADGGTGGIEFEGSAGFGVGDDDDAGIGERFVDGVADSDGDQVVAAGCGAEAGRLDGGEEVGDEEDGGAAALDPDKVLKGSCEVGAGRSGAGAQDFADDAEDMGGAAGGANVALGAAGKEEQADTVLVPDCGEGEDGGDFGGEGALGDGRGAGELGCGDVDDEDDGEVAVFAVAADEGFAGAGVGVPVECADIVAGDVGAEFIELEAAAAEDGVVLAEEEGVDEAAGAQLDGADAGEELRCEGIAGRRDRGAGGGGAAEGDAETDHATPGAERFRAGRRLRGGGR